MENITSRKNGYIRHLRLLSTDASYRRQQGEYLCDGVKMLREALEYGAQVSSVLWKDTAQEIAMPTGVEQYCAPGELFDYASFEKSGSGPLFAVKIFNPEQVEAPQNAIVLDGVQDPGNVGTVIRTANAFGIEAVILTGECADLYNTKTVRATMGAIFRQRVITMKYAELSELKLPIYGAALSDKAVDIRSAKLEGAAVAIGSEGRGLSRAVLDMCAGEVIIPMQPCSESLNAAVAAAIAMWEMSR